MDELLSQRPWVDTISNLMTSIRATAQPAQATTNPNDVPPPGADGANAGGLPGGTTDANPDDPTQYQQLTNAVNHLMTHQAVYLLEMPSFAGMKQLVEATPLMMMQASSESDNVLVLFDLLGDTQTISHKFASCRLGRTSSTSHFAQWLLPATVSTNQRNPTTEKSTCARVVAGIVKVRLPRQSRIAK